MKMKILFIIIVSSLFMEFCGTNTIANAYFDTKFRIATDNTFEQNVIAEILRVFIEERAGTPSEIVVFDGYNNCLKAMKDGLVDVIISYIPGTNNFHVDFEQFKSKYEKIFNYTLFPYYAEVFKKDGDFLLAPAVRFDILSDQLAPNNIPQIFNAFNYQKINEFIKIIGSNRKNYGIIPELVQDFLLKEKMI